MLPRDGDAQVDCRRTDRNQVLFAVPDEFVGNEEQEGGGAGADNIETANGGMEESEPGSQTALNSKCKVHAAVWSLSDLAFPGHIASLRTILMTYHMYSPTLGYVQGMSDLLSPIYVVFDADEALSFWAFVGLMQMTVSTMSSAACLTGVLIQLSRRTTSCAIRVACAPSSQRCSSSSASWTRTSTRTSVSCDLAWLIARADQPTLTENTESLNLFFCFRWILIIFKREFDFKDIPRLWDVGHTRGLIPGPTTKRVLFLYFCRLYSRATTAPASSYSSLWPSCRNIET